MHNLESKEDDSPFEELRKKQKREHILCAVFSLGRIQSELRHFVDLGMDFDEEDGIGALYLEHCHSLNWVNEQLFYAYKDCDLSDLQELVSLDKQLLIDKEHEISNLKFQLKDMAKSYFDLKEKYESEAISDYIDEKVTCAKS